MVFSVLLEANRKERGIILFCSVTWARSSIGLDCIRNLLDPCFFSKLPMPIWNKVLSLKMKLYQSCTYNLYIYKIFIQSPFQRRGVFWMSAPTNVVFSILESKPCKGTAWYKLLMQKCKKAKRSQWPFSVKTKSLELQRVHQVLSERAVGLSKGIPSVGLQQSLLKISSRPVKEKGSCNATVEVLQ